MNDYTRYLRAMKISLFGVIIPAIFIGLSTAVVVLLPGLSSMVQTDYFSCHLQVIGASNSSQFFTTPSICSWLLPFQWILISIGIVSIISLLIILKPTIRFKKFLPLIICGTITILAFIISAITNNDDIDLAGLMFVGVTLLVFIYTIQVKSEYINSFDLRGSLNANKTTNPIGYWTIIVLETITGILIIALPACYFIFGTLQFN